MASSLEVAAQRRRQVSIGVDLGQFGSVYARQMQATLSLAAAQLTPAVGLDERACIHHAWSLQSLLAGPKGNSGQQEFLKRRA